MKKTPIFTGSGTAIVTPFRGDQIDYDKMAELLDQQSAGGTSAIIVCGTTGENATQPIPEHEKLVDFCCQQNNGRMKIIAGVGSNDTMTSIRLATSAKASGADGVLMVTPYYNKTSQEGLIRHFSYVADRVDIPMILYNVPSRTGIGIQPETYRTLAEHPNINGVKEASGDLSAFAKSRALCGDDLFFWSGNDDQIVPMMSLGALGVISVASNIVPDTVSQLCKLCLDGDFRTASTLHLQYTELFQTLFVEVNPIPVKTAMNLMNMDVGSFRLPLVPPSAANREQIKRMLYRYGLLK
ncbi:MAG: 4-hydroxy-tetrahydrodipicolinate synthase [Oscillospiraceae bacterium]|jgi:4-hydroxy-tetrahydrodipicolinate synthase